MKNKFLKKLNDFKKRFVTPLNTIFSLIIIGLIISNIYFIKQYTESENDFVQIMVNTTASLFSGEDMEYYYNTGETDTGYYKMLDNLVSIRDSNNVNIDYLYIIKFEEDGSYFIFDAGNKETNERAELGYFITWKEISNVANQVKPILLQGLPIHAIISDGPFGKLITFHAPIHYKDGSVARGYYVGADILVK
jgi:hypothetical protein